MESTILRLIYLLREISFGLRGFKSGVYSTDFLESTFTENELDGDFSDCAFDELQGHVEDVMPCLRDNLPMLLVFCKKQNGVMPPELKTLKNYLEQNLELISALENQGIGFYLFELNFLKDFCYDYLSWINAYFPNTIDPTPTTASNVAAVEVSTPTDKPTADFSHMESFEPDVPFVMSALYSFLMAKGVISDIEEQLFSDCISHAYIVELWNNPHVIKKRKRNLLQCLLKMLAQDYFRRDWIVRCAESVNLHKKQITNPTSSQITKQFEDELRHILKEKK